MTRILLIEDEATTRRSIQGVLEAHGYEVILAGDGLKGLERVRSDAPDLVLCDITLPSLDGYQVLRGVRSEPQIAGTPFILLTAQATIAELRAGMNYGADDYLIKPVSDQDLLDAVAARLVRARLQSPSRPVPRSPRALERLGLTRREAEVLHWLSQGKSNPDIAAILGLGLATVKTHVLHIFEKLGVENRGSAILRTLEIAEISCAVENTAVEALHA
jgi:DNA-binding NarL/FixJ family response regulator